VTPRILSYKAQENSKELVPTTDSSGRQVSHKRCESSKKGTMTISDYTDDDISNQGKLAENLKGLSERLHKKIPALGLQ